MLLHYLVKVKTKNVILQWDVAKENCIGCMYHGFIASSKWTRSSCALNLLIWGVIQQCLYETKIDDLNDLQECLMQTWFDFD